MEIIGLIFLALGPGIAIALYVYYSDKWEPEPVKLVISIFGLGILATWPAIIYEQAFEEIFGLHGVIQDSSSFSIWEIAFTAFIGVALAEELSKFLILRYSAYENREFNEPFDGVVYGCMVGCGFGAFENLFYVFQMGYSVGVMRMFTAVPFHAFNGILLGYFMGKAKFGPHPEKQFVKGVVLAIFFHGAYDTAAFYGGNISFVVLLGILAFMIYLGLKAKNELLDHSELIDLSRKEFFIVKDGAGEGPFNLKDIRGGLSVGKVKLTDVLTGVKSGKTSTVKEVLYAEIGEEYEGWVKTPGQILPVKNFMVLWGLTLGLYVYFWFLRNYKEFKSYKDLSLNPEMRAVAFFSLTIFPTFIFFSIFGEQNRDPVFEISFLMALEGIGICFLFFQLRLIKGILKEHLEKSFSIFFILILVFAFSCLGILIPLDSLQLFSIHMVLVLIQGGIFAFVQRDLNRYWQMESDHPGAQPPMTPRRA